MRKQKKYHYIYKTTNKLNDRYYYGLHSTNNLDDGYLGSGTYLRRSLKKYGRENFIKEIIEFCDTRNELKKRETDIVNLQQIANKNCMNLKIGGDGNWQLNKTGYWKNHKFSNEHRKKLSISHIGLKQTSETIEKRVSKFRGISKSEETKQKIRESKLNKKRQSFSEEWKIKISNSMKGKTWQHSKKTCPYCELEGSGGNMKRYHFDNCKKNKNENTKNNI